LLKNESKSKLFNIKILTNGAQENSQIFPKDSITKTVEEKEKSIANKSAINNFYKFS